MRSIMPVIRSPSMGEWKSRKTPRRGWEGDRIKRHIERLQTPFTFARITENIARNDIMERGLKAAAAEAGEEASGQRELPTALERESL
jgi:hypothetical protein